VEAEGSESTVDFRGIGVQAIRVEARLRIDRRVSPPTFTFASPQPKEGEAKVKAGGDGGDQTESAWFRGLGSRSNKPLSATSVDIGDLWVRRLTCGRVDEPRGDSRRSKSVLSRADRPAKKKEMAGLDFGDS
jgi:hypothetical protein